MPTPDEVDAAGCCGPLDSNQMLIYLSRYTGATYKGRPIASGKWYSVTNNGQTIGLIWQAKTTFYAFSADKALLGPGAEAESLDAAHRLITAE
jgi:hypothetical protein